MPTPLAAFKRHVDRQGLNGDGCKVQHCGQPVYARQLFEAPDRSTCSVEVCYGHYGLTPLNMSVRPGPPA